VSCRLTGASKTESALRIFGADRALLLVEGVAVGKLIMLSIAQPLPPLAALATPSFVALTRLAPGSERVIWSRSVFAEVQNKAVRPAFE
jgi:hypothetical protein